MSAMLSSKETFFDGDVSSLDIVPKEMVTYLDVFHP
ncbi:hypothetical protein Tco_1550651, partial [Tanacetum coccineum]